MSEPVGIRLQLTVPFPRAAIRAIVPLEGKHQGWQVHFLDGNVGLFDCDFVLFGKSDPGGIVTAPAAALNRLNGRLGNGV